jgi:hypothetical protein
VPRVRAGARRMRPNAAEAVEARDKVAGCHELEPSYGLRATNTFAT